MIAPDHAEFEPLVEALRLLGHPFRLAIVARLAAGEASVGEIAESAGQGLSITSQQLALLRKAELVTTRRAAKQVYYTLASERLSAVAAALAGFAGEAPQLQPTSNPSPPDAHVGAAMFARVLPRN